MLKALQCICSIINKALNIDIGRCYKCIIISVISICRYRNDENNNQRRRVMVLEIRPCVMWYMVSWKCGEMWPGENQAKCQRRALLFISYRK